MAELMDDIVGLEEYTEPTGPLVGAGLASLFSSSSATDGSPSPYATLPGFTGVDNMFTIRPYEVVPGFDNKFYPINKTYTVPNITVLSKSYNSDRAQVRLMGTKVTTGITPGGRTVGGTIILNYSVDPGLLAAHPVFSEYGAGQDTSLLVFLSENGATVNEQFYETFKDIMQEGGSLLMDSAAPFDIYIEAQNELGYYVGSVIYGVFIVSGAETYNVNDGSIEVTYQYLAMGATATLPGKLIASLRALDAEGWSGFLNKMIKSDNRYGLLNIGKDRRYY